MSVGRVCGAELNERSSIIPPLFFFNKSKVFIMPKIHKNTGESQYTVYHASESDAKKPEGTPIDVKIFNGWVARNSYDATQSFEKNNPGRKVVRIERQTLSHLV